MLRMNQSLSRIAYLLLPAIACGVSVYAGSFSVNPVRIELTAARRNALVQIANLSERTGRQSKCMLFPGDQTTTTRASIYRRTMF